MTNNRTIFGATMLIAGCCIGAGMIGLPVMSALTGFMPSVIAMALCYLFTTVTGLLLLEATLWFDTKVNLPSIVEFALGKKGRIVTIALFLFLFYCIFIAYLDAGGSIFAEILSALLSIQITHMVGVLTCAGLVFATAYAGTMIVDNVNRSLLAAMIISYLVLLAIGLPNVNQENLHFTNWPAMFGVVPILLICFGYQNLVPSITYYLNKNVNAIRFAIIIGNLIPFFVYLVWNYVILGMLPVSAALAGNEVQMVVELLQAVAVPSLSVIFILKSFSLFAMLSSFLPSAVSFVDFLKDGSKKGDLAIYSMVFIPPTICTIAYPKLFLNALGFAGGFIDVLLFGALPATVILLGRRMLTTKAAYQVMGGNLTPMIILIGSLAVLVFKLHGMLFKI